MLAKTEEIYDLVYKLRACEELKHFWNDLKNVHQQESKMLNEKIWATHQFLKANIEI